MSKSYKKKTIEEDIVLENETLSKKEQYDLEKQKRMKIKEKDQKKKDKSKKKKKSNNQANWGSRIFAIIMLI